MNLFYPVEALAKWVTYNLFSLSKTSVLGNAIEFFIFDTLKIFILLFVLIFFISLLRSYISKNKIQKILTNKKQYVGHILASLFGIITPFCSCSSVPLFLTFLEASVPAGIAFSFLIASPLINEIAIIMLISLFGIKITLIYVFSGLIISIFSGIILGRLKADKWILKDMLINDNTTQKKCSCKCKTTFKQKLSSSLGYALSIIKKIWLYIIIGVGIGAWIHGYVPDDFLTKYAGGNQWYDVPFSVILGIPLYSNSAGIIPLITSLTEKGLPVGTALAFMMAVTGLSLPEFLILKRIMQWKLILIFAATVGCGIIVIGYLLNMVL